MLRKLPSKHKLGVFRSQGRLIGRDSLSTRLELLQDGLIADRGRTTSGECLGLVVSHGHVLRHFRKLFPDGWIEALQFRNQLLHGQRIALRSLGDLRDKSSRLDEVVVSRFGDKWRDRSSNQIRSQIVELDEDVHLPGDQVFSGR